MFDPLTELPILGQLFLLVLKSYKQFLHQFARKVNANFQQTAKN